MFQLKRRRKLSRGIEYLIFNYNFCLHQMRFYCFLLVLENVGLNLNIEFSCIRSNCPIPR